MHYSTEFDGLVLEIYPLTKNQQQADKNLRLGFKVDHLDQTMSTLFASNWKIVTSVQDTEWGKTAIIQDLDGRKIELKEKSN